MSNKPEQKPLPLGTRIAFLNEFEQITAVATKTAEGQWSGEQGSLRFLTDLQVHEFRSIRILPVTRDEHFERLNVYPNDPVVGDKWEIDEETFNEFLNVLPPLAWNGRSFYMSEFYQGNVTTRYSTYMGKFYCEWAIYPPRRYYFLNRPPFIGTHPHGESSRESWQPRQVIPGTERPAHGWVEYPRELEFYDVWRFELYPADEGELNRYNEWREAENR